MLCRFTTYIECILAYNVSHVYYELMTVTQRSLKKFSNHSAERFRLWLCALEPCTQLTLNFYYYSEQTVLQMESASNPCIPPHQLLHDWWTVVAVYIIIYYTVWPCLHLWLFFAGSVPPLRLRLEWVQFRLWCYSQLEFQEEGCTDLSTVQGK